MRAGWFQVYALGWMLAGAALLAAAIHARTGALTFTLDDPYIHLALAEEILRGHYGINPGEFASPSSSMLYAPLLAPLLALGAGTLAPLVLALAGQGAAVLLLARAVAPPQLWAALLAAPLMVLAINGYALPFTGMEHPLHAAASVAVILGLARAARGPVPRWLVPAILLCPALRFEGYALALAAILTLALIRHRRAALVAAAGLAVLTFSYAAAMRAMGLPLLPSSVMVKSAVSAAAAEADTRGALVALVVNAIRGASTWQGALLALTGLALALLAIRDRSLGAIVWPALAAVVAHLLVGRFGWFGRYEVYAVALLLAALALALRGRPLPVLLAMALFGWGYLPTTVQTPAAALSVHQQQEQMHRFATDYFPHPVAVNDLGWMAWDNDLPVLDLWGLGSEEARRLTATEGRTVETIRTLTAGRAAYAMIYDIAFDGAIPPEWCRVATLTTSRVIAASDTVGIWLIERDREAAIREALTRFAPTLPGGALLTLQDCP